MLLAVSSCLVAQDGPTPPSRDRAIIFYSAGRWSDALEQFTALSARYPGDPLYRYYSGVCLVKLGQDPGRAASLLEEAIRKDSQLRPVPVDAAFYLGRAYQLAGRFTEAVSQYDIFRERARKKEVKELGVERYISECASGSGAISRQVEANNLPEQEVVNEPRLR
ncbi:MAG: tetratricopeptide repeat protein [Bacteroidales bacterium]